MTEDTIKAVHKTYMCVCVELELDSPICFNLMDNFPFCLAQKKGNNTD